MITSFFKRKVGADEEAANNGNEEAAASREPVKDAKQLNEALGSLSVPTKGAYAALKSVAPEAPMFSMARSPTFPSIMACTHACACFESDLRVCANATRPQANSQGRCG